ncbi:uncharacterized protein C4orf19 homolog [Rhinatrema bivittatum]|uniref:uncharacterized protein C4orf19 homolog n=1 Tax=Rhinatrema bivittatum TaxID=194408 RepID=UPI00112C9D50|nr:uncharacterized protein C4orf19 homolog [Rhinatrema bivittatum]
MGCRCCRMIQSYIFDPVEAPSTGYLNEANTFSNNDRETDQDRVKIDREIVIHKNELQNEGQKITVNNKKFSNVEDSSRNHGRDVYGESMGNGVEKSDTAINGLVSNIFLYPILDGHANQMKEVSHDVHLSPFSKSSAQGNFEMRTLPQLNRSGKESVQEAGTSMKLASEGHESIQDESFESTEENNSLTESAILEMPNASMLGQNDYCQMDYSNDDDKITFSKAEKDLEQVTEFPVWKCHGFDLCSNWEAICDPAEGENQNKVSEAYFQKGPYAGGQCVDTPPSTTSVSEDFSSEELNGEDIEDADVAEALAALEAATAGEDEDEEY